MNEKYQIFQETTNIIQNDKHIVCFYEKHISIYTKDYELIFDFPAEHQLCHGCFSPDGTKILFLPQEYYFMVYDLKTSVMSPKIFIHLSGYDIMPLGDTGGLWDSSEKYILIPVSVYCSYDRLYIFDSETFELVRIEDFDKKYYCFQHAYDSENKLNYLFCYAYPNTKKEMRKPTEKAYIFSYDLQMSKIITVPIYKWETIQWHVFYNNYLNKIIFHGTYKIYFVDPVLGNTIIFNDLLKLRNEKTYKILKKYLNYISFFYIEKNIIIFQAWLKGVVFCLNLETFDILYETKKIEYTIEKVETISNNIWALLNYDNALFLVLNEDNSFSLRNKIV